MCSVWEVQCLGWGSPKKTLDEASHTSYPLGKIPWQLWRHWVCKKQGKEGRQNCVIKSSPTRLTALKPTAEVWDPQVTRGTWGAREWDSSAVRVHLKRTRCTQVQATEVRPHWWFCSMVVGMDGRCWLLIHRALHTVCGMLWVTLWGRVQRVPGKTQDVAGRMKLEEDS